MRGRVEWRNGCGLVVHLVKPSFVLGNLDLQDRFLVAFLSVVEHD